VIDNFAKLLADVLQGLGYPSKDELEVEDAAQAARDRLALRDLHLTQSGERWSTAKVNFTPSQSQREKDLSGILVGVPLWLERKDGTEPDEEWVYIPAVNLASVEEARERGEEFCAFFKEDGKLKVRLSETPDGATIYRVRYYRDPSGLQTATDALSIPPQFVPFITAEIKLDLIPTILRNLAANAANPPDELTLLAWKATAARLNEIVEQWLPLWRQHRLGSKGAARGRDRRPVLG
jgi:hypothetical protein